MTPEEFNDKYVNIQVKLEELGMAINSGAQHMKRQADRGSMLYTLPFANSSMHAWREILHDLADETYYLYEGSYLDGMPQEELILDDE